MTDPEFARKLFTQRCDFILAASEPAHFPSPSLPEVAFIGRSNVGKSSLVNALVGRKNLARASGTPGRTQQIVFFDLGGKLMLVDLPGYGHANAPYEQKKRWTGLVQTYLRKRETLKCVCLLLDGRHEIKDNDLEMMDFLDDAAVVYKLVLTKTDGLREGRTENPIEKATTLAAKHAAALSGIIATSSEKKQGIDELREFLAKIIFREI